MRRKKEKSLIFIFIIGYLAYSSIYIARLNFSVASALFESMGTLDKAQIGMIGSIFSITYAIAKIPNGYIGDRFSTKKVIITGLLITSISNLFIGLFPNFYSIGVLWGLNAYGQSMLWGPMLRTFSDRYGEEKFKKISQYLVSSVAVGSIIGLLLASGCGSLGNAAVCFLIPSAITFFMAVMVRFFFVDAPGKEAAQSFSMKHAIKNVFRDRSFRWMILPTMTHGMIKDNINVWLAIYFVDTFCIDLKAMAGYVFFVPALAFIGRLLYPAAYKILKNEYYVSIFSFLLCTAATAVIAMEKVTAPVAMLCLGLVSALVSMINTHLLSIFPAAFSSTGNISFVASVMDLLAYGGAGIGSLVFGVLIQQFGYRSMFLIWCAASAASILFLYRACRIQAKETV